MVSSEDERGDDAKLKHRRHAAVDLRRNEERACLSLELAKQIWKRRVLVAVQLPNNVQDRKQELQVHGLFHLCVPNPKKKKQKRARNQTCRERSVSAQLLVYTCVCFSRSNGGVTTETKTAQQQKQSAAYARLERVQSKVVQQLLQGCLAAQPERVCGALEFRLSDAPLAFHARGKRFGPLTQRHTL